MIEINYAKIPFRIFSGANLNIKSHKTILLRKKLIIIAIVKHYFAYLCMD